MAHINQRKGFLVHEIDRLNSIIAEKDKEIAKLKRSLSGETDPDPVMTAAACAMAESKVDNNVVSKKRKY
jgi:hypothetical protein